VLTAGGGVAPRQSLLVLGALTGGRVEVSIPAPDLNFTTHSVFRRGKPFNPHRVPASGSGTQRVRSTLGGIAGVRTALSTKAPLALVEGQPVHSAERERNKLMLRIHLENQEQFVAENPPQGGQGGQRPGEDPTQGGQHGQRPGEDPTQGGQHGQQPGEDPTQGGSGGQRPGEDPTQGGSGGQRPGEDPTQGGQHGQRPGEDPTGGKLSG
jgi:hypothetical protein